MAYQVAVDPLRKLLARIPDEGASAGHAGSEVTAGAAKHHHQTAGHILAAVVAHALDHRRRATVADGEALAGLARGKELAAGGAIENGIADQRAVGRPVASVL